MSLTLHLGVLDVPYATPPKKVARARKGRQRLRGSADGQTTTYAVARILEDKYGIMDKFFEAHRAEVEQAIASGYEAAVESVMLGADPETLDPTGEAMSRVQELFHQFLEGEEMAGLAQGVPTAAALRGVSHRRAHPYSKDNPRRPSFIDTGVFESSFRAWVSRQS